MLDEYLSKKAANNLINILNDYKTKANRIITENRSEYMSSLSPGAQVPYNIPLSADYRAQLDTVIKDTRSAFKSEIAPLLDELKKDIATAPSTEATNTISLLTLRSDISENEIDFLLDQYGNNVQCYKAIKDIARKHEINNYTENPTMEQYDKVNNLYNKLDNWDTIKAENMTNGMLSMYEMDINAALNCEDI